MKKNFFSKTAVILIVIFIFVGFGFLYFNIKFYNSGIKQREDRSRLVQNQQKDISTPGQIAGKTIGTDGCEQKIISLISGYITKKTATAIFITQGQGEQMREREVLVLPDTRYLKIMTNEKGETLSSEVIEYSDFPDLGSIVAVVYDVQGDKASGEELKYLVFE